MVVLGTYIFLYTKTWPRQWTILQKNIRRLRRIYTRISNGRKMSTTRRKYVMRIGGLDKINLPRVVSSFRERASINQSRAVRAAGKRPFQKLRTILRSYKRAVFFFFFCVFLSTNYAPLQITDRNAAGGSGGKKKLLRITAKLISKICSNDKRTFRNYILRWGACEKTHRHESLAVSVKPKTLHWPWD